jgi:predicted transcriptional regulator
MQSGGFLQQLLIVNVMLVVFNLLPIFPLDGGRVFRALLAMVFSFSTATRVAATVGQVSAVGLGLLGFANPFMFLIALFVFFGAAAEARQVSMREQLGQVAVRDGMLRQFTVAPSHVPVRHMAERLLDSPQRDFPVIDDGIFVGMLRREQILESIDSDGSLLVSDVMDRDVSVVEESEALVSALERVTPDSGQTLPVINAGALTGLIDLQQVFEVAKARVSLRKSAAYAAVL